MFSPPGNFILFFVHFTFLLQLTAFLLSCVCADASLPGRGALLSRESTQGIGGDLHITHLFSGT